ncbi:hypothetical protein XENTR_v10004956 [Xenopus tropicalis]|nr:hypothetical protein XENTR_v10004956 [Xenopus tropicalis]
MLKICFIIFSTDLSYKMMFSYLNQENRRDMPPFEPAFKDSEESSDSSDESSSHHSCNCEENRRDIPPFQPASEDSEEYSSDTSDEDSEDYCWGLMDIDWFKPGPERPRQ